MKLALLVSIGILASSATAAYQCPVTLSADAAVIEFAYSIQNFLYQYYLSVPANVTFFDELPTGSTISPVNNQALAVNSVTNFLGLQNQAMLAVKGLAELGSMTPDWTIPTCPYTYPTVKNASMHISNAYYIEATLCGAFIGLADYAMSPTVAFFMARLAADHGTHAAFLKTYLSGTLFSATSISLVPAFTPANITTPGSSVGNIGQYLGNCIALPAAPCGGSVVIGNPLAMLVNQTVTSPPSTCSSTAVASHAPTTTRTIPVGSNLTTSAIPVQFTGAAVKGSASKWTWTYSLILVAILT